jgi:ribose 5-phosphate isomerase RpiB
MPQAVSDDGASFGFSANVSRRMRANHGANPKGNKEGRCMNDAQTLVLIHAVAWPILIWALIKTWSTHDFPSEAQTRR